MPLISGGSETPTYTRNYLVLVGSHHHDHQRRGPWRERTGLPAACETISQRRLSMLGHMSEDAYKAIYQDIPSDWRRRPGRPRQSTVLAGYHTPRSAETWYWLGQRSRTCCRSCTMEGADSWRYAALWCMLLPTDDDDLYYQGYC